MTAARKIRCLSSWAGPQGYATQPLPRGSYEQLTVLAAQIEKRRMSKVRINDLARELEVKSRQVLDILAELGLDSGKTHSSSLEDYEADKVRAHFERGKHPASQAGAPASRAPQGIVPKIDLSHISKPGDVLKAIQAKQKETEEAARRSHFPSRPAVSAPPPVEVHKPAPVAVVAAPPVAAPARPEPRKIVPQPRQAPPIVVTPPPPPPGHCIAAASGPGGRQGSGGNGRPRASSGCGGAARRGCGGQAARGARSSTAGRRRSARCQGAGSAACCSAGYCTCSRGCAAGAARPGGSG